MALIEGIGDDVMTLLFVMFIVLIVIMSWLSTSVREMAVPANLLVIERRSRRLYTANLNGNITRINNSSRLSPSLTTTTTTTSDNASSTDPLLAENADQEASTGAHGEASAPASASSSFEPAHRRRSNELELVNEIVEQALVDNLLDGGFYSTEGIDLIQTSSGSVTDLTTLDVSASPIASGSGEVISSVNTFNNRSQANDDGYSNENGLGNAGSTAPIANSQLTTMSAQLPVSPSEESSEPTPQAVVHSLPLADPITILIKFVNEKEMRIQVRPDDTILVLKKTHFSQEISNNKIVRFIYQGQFLNDMMTIKSYNIKDKTTIHCHIIGKPTLGTSAQAQTTLSSSSSSSTPAGHHHEHHQHHLHSHAENLVTTSSSGFQTTTTTSTAAAVANNVRQRLTANRVGGLSRLQTSSTETHASTAEVPPANAAGQPNPATPVANHNPRSQHAWTNIDLNSLLLPLLAILLAACWYFRINFKHFFSPLSTLVLIVLTFIYALFLFNNIHSTSSFATNNYVITSRILHSRRRTVEAQPASTVTPTTTAPVPAIIQQQQ